MAVVKPFKALRFAEKAGDISKLCCPPYDIIGPDEQNALYDISPYNIVRLELGREKDRYSAAAETLKKWLCDGILKRDAADAFYLYEEEFGYGGKTRTLRLLIGLIELTEFSKGVVLPHEETLSKAKADRLDLMRATGCNFSQIYSLYMDEEGVVKEILQRASECPSDVAFEFGGIRQRLWIIRDAETASSITRAFSDKKVYIADGHHRYETAVNFKNDLIEKKIVPENGDHPAKYCMMAFADIDDPGLLVLPTHRLIHGISGFDEKEILKTLSDSFDMDDLQDDSETEEALSSAGDRKVFVMVTKDRCVRLSLREAALSGAMPGKGAAYKALDVAVLHSLILEPVFGIDRENMSRQLNLSYTRSRAEAVSGVKSGRYQCAFILNATRVRQIKDVAQSGEKMPQKSTYFYPKLITGLVMNKILEL